MMVIRKWTCLWQRDEHELSRYLEETPRELHVAQAGTWRNQGSCQSSLLSFECLLTLTGLSRCMESGALRDKSTIALSMKGPRKPP